MFKKQPHVGSDLIVSTARRVQARGAEPPDSVVQTIRRLSFDADGVTVVVDSTTITSAVDAEGHHGPAGASHTLTTTTRFRRFFHAGSAPVAASSRFAPRKDAAPVSATTRPASFLPTRGPARPSASADERSDELRFGRAIEIRFYSR